MILFKTTAKGYTTFLPVLLDETKLKLAHELIFIDKSVINTKHSVLCGKIPLIDIPMEFCRHADELTDIAVISKRFSNIVELDAGVLLAGVRKEKDAVNAVRLGGDVY